MRRINFVIPQPRQPHLKSMLERQELWLVAEMPLADNLVPVAHHGQELGDEDLAVLDTTDYLLWSVGIPTRESVLVKPGTERKTTCQQGGSGGRANGGAAVELGEQETFLGHPGRGSEHTSDFLTFLI